MVMVRAAAELHQLIEVCVEILRYLEKHYTIKQS